LCHSERLSSGKPLLFPGKPSRGFHHVRNRDDHPWLLLYLAVNGRPFPCLPAGRFAGLDSQLLA